MSGIPLKIVPDEIAVPSGTTTIQFGPGVTQLANGNQFQVSAGSITLTYDAGAVITAKQVREMKELADRIIELTRQGQDTLGNAIRKGVPLGPAEPAKEDKTDSLTGVN